MTLVQFLVKKRILDKARAASLEYEIKSSGKSEEEVILEKGVVSENSLFALKGEILNIPFKEEVIFEQVPLKVLELVPEESAKYYQIIPLARKDKSLDVGMVYPENLKAQEALKFLSRQGKFNYQVFLITFTTFNTLLKQYRTLRREVKKALEELETEFRGDSVKPATGIPVKLERVVAEAPISKVVAVILKHAVEGNASDIHIEPTREQLRVRFRLDGILHASIFLPLKIRAAVVARIKILSDLKIDETRIPQDGRFSTKLNDKVIDFRVSTFPTTLGEKVVIRVLNPDKGLKGFKGLGLEGKNLETIKKSAKRPYGLILVSGPTGCGKSTTLYSILNLLNKEGVNIITLEDPVEYFIEGINQSQIKPEIGYTFATGLRHMMRQDPDIIMVGEIRDKETAALATHAALTGHIVLSTIHTTNSLGVIPRLIDLDVQSFLISPTLSIAVAQRLARKLCSDCRKKVEPKKQIRDFIWKEIGLLSSAVKKEHNLPSDPKDIRIWETKGCRKCNWTGYSGRVGVFEVLKMTSQLSDIILKEPSETKIAEEARRQGMITMQQDGILKSLDGLTSIQEVVRVAEEK